MNEIHVLLNGEHMGTLARDDRNRLRFTYSRSWLSKSAPAPLSLSMPVLDQAYSGRTLENWLWGLLPDDPETLARMARQFHVSPNNVFSLLRELGEDVAGAVQFIPPDRVEKTIANSEVRWLDAADMDSRFEALQRDAADTRRMDDPGRFSLAGAQAKVALLELDGRWGVPGGRMPTNRIVKLASGMFEGLIENEHFCIQLVKAVGLNAVESRVMTRAGITAIVVDRYDRVETSNGELVRVHQEDMCQASGIHPHQRYENEGGPGVLDILDVLNASSEPVVDREAFVRMQIVNFLIGGSDAHAKNFNVLLGNNHAVRLAPFYDVASILPYQDFKACKLAMKIGQSCAFEHTLPRHWEALGKRIGNGKLVMKALETYARQIKAALPRVASEIEADGIHHEIIPRLVDSIGQNCDRALNALRYYSERTR